MTATRVTPPRTPGYVADAPPGMWTAPPGTVIHSSTGTYVSDPTAIAALGRMARR
jgi:hypothetical protein